LLGGVCKALLNQHKVNSMRYFMDVEKTHKQQLLEAHTNRLQKLELRAATMGLNTPPEVLIEIEDIKGKVKALKQEIADISNLSVEEDGNEYLEKVVLEQTELDVVMEEWRSTTGSPRYNVVMLGKAGVGKTSLINYFYGQEIGKTGIGSSVTPEFIPIDFKVNEQSVRVFDSEGLSTGKADEWKEKLESFLSQYGIDKSPTEWLHAIFYCFSVGGSRIEDFEIDLINELLRSNYRLTVVFTKADQGHENDVFYLQEYLNESLGERLPIIAVCSVTGKRYDGSAIKQFGKSELEGQVYLDFWNSICQRLPERCEMLAIQMVDDWEREQHSEIQRFISAKCDLNYIYSQLKDNTSRFSRALSRQIADMINQEIEYTVKMFSTFSTALGYPPKWLQELADVKLEVNLYSYNRGELKSVVEKVFAVSTLFDTGWTSYFDDIKEELDKFNLDPSNRKSEMLSDLGSATYRFRKMIEGENSRWSKSPYSSISIFKEDEENEERGEIENSSESLFASPDLKKQKNFKPTGVRNIVMRALLEINPTEEV
jgi:GTPase SAR1 family protein